MSVHMRPEEIEAESFRIIEEELGHHDWSAQDWPLVRRAIHTSADFDYARNMFIAKGAVDSGIAALKAGCGIVTDTTMIISGMSKERLKQFGVLVSCYVADPQVAKDAKAQLITRSIVAMRKGARDPKNGIFVIGNAPTALYELIRLIREERVRPRLIVALPVGFVGAAESKEALKELAKDFPELPFITNTGRKGGSNVAAAVMNAILIQAESSL
ncbi:cobalt-precorrin-8X methylmutase [Citrifermentans bemidjiense Bem]|uniref:Cobalt-precorrin-8X methylmutase n=1 Tax=Citrifermentans bemidjiense (strain ATCC BAA-1014 / DSM 16622 / JCM 12645 / Bem) TaxID=404380 RepID=B5EC82_CITBB|nr:precorrin-8X methylmutase [Citrifermentans bemidjiense]ACH40538.1 cobalt-precorrin-8X methylmutase [Citrifermentans bemidjiense Bem]